MEPMSCWTVRALLGLPILLALGFGAWASVAATVVCGAVLGLFLASGLPLVADGKAASGAGARGGRYPRGGSSSP